ncbi:MAG: DNA polymerase III subunit delta [Halieaceae bacterium]|nr:DNA polymerase III subunit delta [Halieaceae bacterium]
MRVKPHQLGEHLQGQLQPLYLVTGDELLLVQEACDTIRTACRDQGLAEREILLVEGKFDWNRLLASSAELSLFAGRKLIELRMPGAKPGTAGSKALQQFLDNPNPDNVLLIVAGKVDRQATNSKWFKALDQAGVVVQVWPVDARQMPRWIQDRLRQQGLNIEPDALQMLSERVEGNLLAAAQEIEKLRLFAEGGVITGKIVGEAVSDNARYNLFSMADQTLLGNSSAALRMLQGLRAEGEEAALILWAISRELRLLHQCRNEIDKGQAERRVLQAQRVWEQRIPVVSAALHRHSLTGLGELMQQAAHTDRAIKGMSDENQWALLSDLLLSLSRETESTRGRLAPNVG